MGEEFKQKQEIMSIRQDLEDINGMNGIHILGYIPLAEALYNVGYRKIPEGAVVLKREEYDGKEIVVEMSGGHKLRLNVGKFGEMSKILEEYTRKETAEKLLDEIDYESNGQTKSITDLFRKKYGV